jgi:hypothetical protein
MSGPRPDDSATNRPIESDSVAQHIAKGTRQIIDAMEESMENCEFSFEDDAKELAKKSQIEKLENQKSFEKERDRIREQFGRKWRRY